MKKLLIICLFLFALKGISQEEFEIKKIGFSMNTPKDWISVKNDEILKNLDNYEFSDEQLDHLLQSNTALVTFTKYDLKKHAGIIPTIKISSNKIPTTNISVFLKSIENSIAETRKSLPDIRFVEQPVGVKISGKDALKFAVQYSLKNAGNEHQIISHSYYILRNGYYISLNFIEEVGKEDNEKVFDDLFQSIKITK